MCGLCKLSLCLPVGVIGSLHYLLTFHDVSDFNTGTVTSSGQNCITSNIFYTNIGRPIDLYLYMLTIHISLKANLKIYRANITYEAVALVKKYRPE